MTWCHDLRSFSLSSFTFIKSYRIVKTNKQNIPKSQKQTLRIGRNVNAYWRKLQWESHKNNMHKTPNPNKPEDNFKVGRESKACLVLLFIECLKFFYMHETILAQVVSTHFLLPTWILTHSHSALPCTSNSARSWRVPGEVQGSLCPARMLITSRATAVTVSLSSALLRVYCLRTSE